MSPRRTTYSQLNTRLLCLSIAGFAVVGTVAYFVHSRQVKAMAAAYLARANELEQQKEFDKAAQNIGKYVAMRPDDPEARARYAIVVDHASPEGTQKSFATRLYYQAIGQLPRRTDLRQRLAELLYEQQRYTDTRDEAKTILADEPDDPQARRLLALAEFQSRQGNLHADWSNVAQLLTEAIAVNPKDIELSQCLAEVQRAYLEPAQPETADQTMDQLVEAANSSPQSLLARASYRQKYSVPGADKDLDAAFAAAPNDINVLLAMADRSRLRRQSDDAIRYYKSLIELAPLDRRGYLGLGEVYRQRGEADQAIEAWRSGLQKIGKTDLILGWQLADFLVEQGQLEAADEQLDTLLATVRKLQPRITARQYQSIYNACDYVRAKFWITKHEPLRAIQILTRLAIVPDSYSEGSPLRVLQLEVQCRLAGAWGMVGHWDQSAALYADAASQRPLEPALRIAAAKAWMMASQPENAIRHLQVLFAKPTVAPEVALLYAQAQFSQQTRLPLSRRDWSAFDDAVAKITNLGTNGWQVILLKTDAAFAKGHQDEAIRLIEQAEREYPSQAQCLSAVAIEYERLGRPDQANRVLERLTEVASAPTTAILARVDVLCQRKDLDAATKLLESEIPNASSSDRATLSDRLAQLLIQNGKIDEGRKAFAELVAHDPNNLQLLQQQAELALELHDREQSALCETRLHELEGADGAWWRLVRARRLLDVNERSNRVEIEQLTKELESTRPSWVETHRLRATLAERQGNNKQAADALRRAIALGDRRIADYERLISILFRIQQFDAAAEVLDSVQQQNSESENLAGLAIALSLKQSDVDRAITLAQELAKRRPKDPLPQIWLGQSELLANQQAKAEEAFRHATEIAPADPRAWQAQFRFYLQAKQLDSARETLEQMARSVPLTDEKREALLGQGYELLNDLPLAVAHFQKAMQLSPDNAAIQQRLAAILVRTNDPAVDSMLNRMENSANNGNARRNLAVLMLARGDAASCDKALKLLSATDDQDAVDTAANNRLRALALIRRGRPENRAEAIRLLNALVDRPTDAQPADRLLLAQLYEAEGSNDLAGDQLRKLAEEPTAQPAQLAVYAEFLLKSGKNDEAKQWINKLQQVSPGSWANTSLEAQWLHALKRDAEIEPLVEQSARRILAQAKNNHEKAQVASSVGQLYANLRLTKLAIQYCQMAYDLSPDLYPPLVAALCADRQISSALEICRTAAKTDSSSKPAQVLAAAVTNSGCTSEEIVPQADDYLTEALTQFANDVPLRLSVSGVRYMQGKMQAVIDLSREVLALEPKNPLALNNLSSLLAEQPEHRAEALDLINRALDGQSHNATLLDTKAMILFHQGQSDAAADLLEQVIKRPVADPRIRFHCALVYQRLNQLDRARDFLAESQTAGLTIGSLSPLEQKLLVELEKALKPSSSTSNARLSSSNIR